MPDPIDQQLKHNDCGISAVKIIYNLFDIHVSRDYIEENIFLNDNGSSLHDIKDFFEKEHFKTEFNLLDTNTLKFTPEKLKEYIPCILPIKNKQGLHYVVIKDIRKNKLQILDPAKGVSYNLSFSELMNRAYTATANYDYASSSQLLQQVIIDELSLYNIDANSIEDQNKGDVLNKLTYFSYLKENFGFANVEAEKKFLQDLLLNQELNALPKQFRTLKLNEAKLRITAPVVLSIGKTEQVKLPATRKPEVEKPVNSYRRLVSEMKPYHKLWGIYITAAF